MYICILYSFSRQNVGCIRRARPISSPIVGNTHQGINVGAIPVRCFCIYASLHFSLTKQNNYLKDRNFAPNIYLKIAHIENGYIS